jgi:site-specific DNA recombinase
MIAAIYARKSTEQNVPDDAKSVARQLDQARAFAAKRGWQVDAAHVYVDDAISGAEYLKRPAYLRLMAALEPAPPFGALVVMEQSRLGRDTGRVLLAIQALEEAGVEIWSYQGGGSPISVADESGEVNATVLGLVDKMHKRQASRRGRETGQSKASKGHVAGGKVFGYRNVREAGHVARVIHEPEAAIVRRLFAECAAGRGFTRIAKGFTAEGVPSPHPGRGWAASAVREMLFRPLYRGEIVYGKTRWQQKGGTKCKVRVPEAEWIRVEAPALAIVTDAEWRAAHQRLDRTRASYLRSTKGRLWGRPEAGLEGKYLLSGFVHCGTCGGAMHATKRTSLRGAPQLYYVCRTHRVRGDLLCANYWSAPMADLHADVCATLARDVLTPARIEKTIRRAIDLHAASPETTADRQATLTRDLRRLDQEIGRLTGAIATGAPLPSLLDALRQRERARAELQAQLEHLDGLSRAAARWEGDDLAAELAARLAEWQAVLGGQPVLARQILRKLLAGRLRMLPERLPEGRFYRWTVPASYGRLLAGLIGVQGMVPPG